ncbi:MAG: discoidin domain-containing protein, partial [Lachnospiraceae bacterium]|nr:discoidin domain-containing protein [Lachnospiraceae bacterium]
MKKMKKILCLLLVFAMTFGCMSGMAFAATGTRPEDGVTEEQPFLAGTGGSQQFRIPCMVTLDDGTIVAGCDARWTTSADGGGLDTIVSYSKDNGATWNYTFANHLGDNGNVWNAGSTAFIDPAMTTDGETVYMIADLFPAGIALNGASYGPKTGSTGYDSNGNLVLAAVTDSVSGSSSSDLRAAAAYDYHLEKIADAADDAESYYLLKDADGNTVDGYTIDAYFNIKGENVDTNLFCGDSPYFPYPTDFLYFTKSTDGGATWSVPSLLDVKYDTEATLLVCPGRALVTSTDRIVFPVYEHTSGTEYTSVIYSDDGGKTWERSANMSNNSSEAAIAEADGRLYMFTRHGGYYVSEDWGETWSSKKAVEPNYDTTTQLSAITYSEKIDGKTAILLSVPGLYRRLNGAVYVVLVEEDGSLDWAYKFDVTDNSEFFAYSCLSELENGEVGLLWEHQGSSIRFDSYTMDEILGYVKNLTIDPEEQYVEEREADSAAEITQASNEAIATVTSEYVVEESTTLLYDHASNTASSLDSFSTTANVGISLEDAELVLTNVDGNIYKAYNEATGKYAYKASSADGAYVKLADSADDAAYQLVLEPTTADDGSVTYRLYRASGNDRYTIFYNTNMDFNTNGGYNAAWTGPGTNGSYELVLLEKQETVSEADIIPGYTRATTITSGNSYLISYIWENASNADDPVNGSVFVLYPNATSTGGQTKLVGDTVNVAKNVVTITGVAPGETSAVVGDVTYNITVNDPTKSPSYAGNDYPAEKLTATAGTVQSGEGSLEALTDGDEETYYHSQYSPSMPGEDDYWITLELEEVTKLSGLRYLPRQSSANGRILEYEILYSLDGEVWDEAASGDWADDASWKRANFDEVVEAKYIKLVAVNSKGDTNGRHLTAAELRVVEATAATEPDFPEPPAEGGLLKAGSISIRKENVTEEQPFAAGTADSTLFRIPALITLDNGDLLAAADARWTTSADWGGLDTIASVSSDNGKTWYYSFPIYFPDSNTTYPGMEVATTAIDPVIVQGADGTIYCIADMNPSGITTGDIMPGYGTGFVEIDGEWRPALTGTYTKPNESDTSSYGNPEDYEYYVGDFDENGFAPVLNKADGSATEWGVDEWYNIYTVNAETGAYEETLTQTMVNDSTVIQQNAFYKDSVLHVYNTGYLWMVTSTDNGKSWGNPQILNTQIKRDTDRALLASPGQGITTSDGDIVIPFYDHGDGQENASVIWSDDNGKTWTRSNDVSGMWSSESEIVELNNGVLRMFYRNGTGYICYADMTKTDGEWTMGTGVQTAIPVCSTCNVTAIRHSETIDGKMVVMVACPGGSGRANGKIFTFLVDEDNSMELYNTFAVNTGAYAYSCMTEVSNGNVGLLWEYQGAAMRYDEFSFEEVIGLEKNIVLDQEEQYVEEKSANAAAEITQAPNEEIATVTSEFIVEEATIALHDHVSNTASSLDSFSNTVGMADLEDAEIVLTNVEGNIYKAYHPATEKYLYKTTNVQLSKADSADTAEQQLVFEPTVADDGTVTYKFYRASDNARYTVFYNTQMNFNAMSGYNATWTDGSYELVLLEKQDTVSNDDVIPGYTRAAEITSGNTYLIAYIWTDGSVIVLYPDAASANDQTKLVGDTVNVAKNVITITGIAPGETTAVVGEVTYNITVNDPTKSPSYAGRDIPVSEMTATAGDAQSGEGPEMVLDENASTTWHTDWYEGPNHDNHWIQFELNDVYTVDGLRYQPRQTGTNGIITGYEIYVSTNGTDWTKVAEGSWAGTSEWKLARFDAVDAKYVKLAVTSALSDQSIKFASAAEIRLTGVKSDAEVPTVDRSGLEAAIAAAEALNAEDYTEESWNALQTVLAALEYLPEEPTQEVIDNATKEITDAIAALEEKPVVEEGGVVRISGKTRYETGYKVADALKAELGVDKFDAVVVATGKNFADALAGSYLAVQKNAPIILTNGKDDNVAQLHDYIAANVTAGGKFYILGGEAAVPASVEAIEGYDVVRLAGKSRYETN